MERPPVGPYLSDLDAELTAVNYPAPVSPVRDSRGDWYLLLTGEKLPPQRPFIPLSERLRPF